MSSLIHKIVSNSKIQRAVKDWANGWTIARQDKLVEFTLTAPLVPGYEQFIEGFPGSIDHEAAIEDWIDSIQPESGREYELSITSSETTGWCVRLVDGAGDIVDEIEGGTDVSGGDGLTKESALADFCEWNDIDITAHTDNDRQVMEWYQVDPSVGERLAAKGQIVVELFGMKLWGRCSSGQSVGMDCIVLELWADTHKDQIVEIFADTEVSWPIERTARGVKMTIEPVGDLVHIGRITHENVPADCVLTPETVELIQDLGLHDDLQFATFPDFKSFYAVAYPLKPYHFDAVRIARVTLTSLKQK